MGLLDQMFSTPQDQALWALGSGLLGVRKGQEGQAMMNALRTYNVADEGRRRNEITELQRKQIEARMKQEAAEPQMFGKLDPSDFTPASLSRFQTTKNYGDLVLNPRNAKMPSSVQEYDFYSQLPKEQQDVFNNLKRAPQQVVIGGVPHMIIGGRPIPTSTIEREMAAKAGLADASSSGRVAGEVRTQAQADLPASEAMIPVLKDRVRQLLSHPGRDLATGWKSVVPPIPGTAQYDFISRHNELRSKAFEQAFQTLKGGGPITEMEGKAATDALIRMDRATTSREYEAAANDFLKAYEAGVRKIQSKTSFSARPQLPPGYMDPAEQARGVRDHGMTERVDRVPDADPLGIR